MNTVLSIIVVYLIANTLIWLFRLKAFYDDYLNVFQTQVPDSDMQRFVNIWNPYN
jgi:cellobiose phosphorylase